jgi:predicted nicotinamide N-methyase
MIAGSALILRARYMSDLRLRYQTVEFGKTDIHLCTLRNTQEFYDPDGVAKSLGISSATWSIFGVVWPSSLVLAHYVAGFNTKSKRVLEVGCGIGLSSLLLNKRHIDITATDYHPETESFLERNALLNGDNKIAFERVDWAESGDELGVFDVIIGSDLLYEDEHCALLATFIGDHSKSSCEVIIVDPGRGRKNKLKKRMLEIGFNSSQVKPDHTDYLEKGFKGHILLFDR